MSNRNSASVPRLLSEIVGLIEPLGLGASVSRVRRLGSPH